MHNFEFCNFFESLKIALINMVTILTISAILATLGLLKIEVSWNNGYDVIISGNDITNKVLSRDSNYFVNVVIWPKFDKPNISIREVIIKLILQDFEQKNQFFEG